MHAQLRVFRDRKNAFYEGLLGTDAGCESTQFNKRILDDQERLPTKVKQKLERC